MKKLSIVIVGYGGMGSYHAELIAGIERFNLSGVYDIDKKSLDLAKERGLKVYNSKEEVANDLNVDAVLIATPNDFHCPLTKFFTSAKKHVFCEKPAALNADEYKTMAASAEKNNVILMVNQNRRCDEDYLLVREIIKSGCLGNVYRIESRVTGANGIPGGWRKNAAQGGGMMLDWGVHLIDQICEMNETEIEYIDSRFSYNLGFKVDDGFNVTLTFKDSLQVLVEVDTNSYIKLPRWMIYGTLGTAKIDGFEADGNIIVNYNSAILAVAKQKGNGLTKTMAERPDESVKQLNVPKIKPDNNKVYNSFIDACLTGAPQYIKHSEVLRVLKIMQKCKSISENRKKITI